MDEKYMEQAEQLALAEINRGIELARKREPTPPGFDGTCNCGDEIPETRIRLGYHRCVTCQSRNEKQGRQFR